MSKLKKIYFICKTGGIKLVLIKVLDVLHGTDCFDRYRYKQFESADASEYARLISSYYTCETGKKIDIENPITFNEKIQWLKLHDSTPMKTQLADKYLVRAWIKDEIGEEYLVPLLGVWDRFDDIDFTELPESFVLKCNHGSGWNLIVKDKKRVNISEEKEKFDHWMSSNFAFMHGELHYKDIPPKIIAEAYLDTSEGLKDYRFYCFHGVPVQVWVDLYSGTPKHIRSIFDMNWNRINLQCTWPDGGEKLSSKPVFFETMKSFAAQLSRQFSFVRVDFFEVNGNLYVGEMTFTPMNGTGVFTPPEWDKRLGELLHLQA